MTTLREAAQQALEFCEFLWREVAMNDYAEEKREATEAALRAALAQQDDDLTAAWMAGAAEERKRAEQPQPLADDDIDILTAKSRDDLMDYIYEYGTTSEGQQRFIRQIARAVEAEVLKRMGVGK